MAQSVVDQILDLARWAPSGDNTQPWRFEILDELHLIVHGRDTRDRCVYDLDGRSSQIAIGALLETLAIAASEHGLDADVGRLLDTPETHPVFDVHLTPDPAVRPDPLVASIRGRTTQRRAMYLQPLSTVQRQALAASIAPSFQVLWLDRLQARLRAAWLMFKSAGIRLTIPEAYHVHREIIEWHARYSEDRIPDRAIGLDPVTLSLMRWAMQSWSRVHFLNRYLAGTLIPRFMLDLIPGWTCAAHFAIVSDAQPHTIDDYIVIGRKLQRFWLTATHLGLYVQPEMTPLIFSNYVRAGIIFTQTGKARQQAKRLSLRLQRLLGQVESQRAVFIGRIGTGPAPHARSLRLPLPRLLVSRQR